MSDIADDPLTLKALERIDALQTEIVGLKAFINQADTLSGRKPRFEGTEAILAPFSAGPPKRGSPRWQAGQFFNKPFSTAVRQVLIDRSTIEDGAPAPASIDEIHDALSQGSFDFGTNGIDSQKNSIRISLGKNSTVFVKLPNSDLFGLVEWYGKRLGRPRKTNGDRTAASAGSEVSGEEAAADEPAATEDTQTTEDRE